MELQTQSSVSPRHVKNLGCQVEKLFNLFINILSSTLSLPPWLKTVHEILYIYCIKREAVFYVSCKLRYGMWTSVQKLHLLGKSWVCLCRNVWKKECSLHFHLQSQHFPTSQTVH